MGYYPMLDRVAKGRQEGEHPEPVDAPHDEYV